MAVLISSDAARRLVEALEAQSDVAFPDIDACFHVREVTFRPLPRPMPADYADYLWATINSLPSGKRPYATCLFNDSEIQIVTPQLEKAFGLDRVPVGLRDAQDGAL